MMPMKKIDITATSAGRRFDSPQPGFSREPIT